jgi:hypothetical protein
LARADWISITVPLVSSFLFFACSGETSEPPAELADSSRRIGAGKEIHQAAGPSPVGPEVVVAAEDPPVIEAED